MELTQQIYWWLSFPLRLKNFNLYKLTIFGFLWASFLNSYNYKEIIKWRKVNLKKNKNILLPLPQTLTWAIHNERRSKVGEIPLDTIELLKNKAKLYNFMPKKIVPSFFVINRSNKNNIKITKKNEDKFLDYLKNSGIILKPLRGFGNNNIFYFKLESNELTYKNLFKDDLVLKILIKNEKVLNYIVEFYFNHINYNDDILISPYIENNSILPKTFPSTVLRVLTKKNKHNEFIIDFYYFEIPLENKRIVRVSQEGKYLPFFEFTNTEKIFIKEYFKKFNKLKLLKDCLYESKICHKKIPSIDQVAWDWIINNNAPILLEGNHIFGLTDVYYLKNV